MDAIPEVLFMCAIFIAYRLFLQESISSFYIYICLAE
jgi:hypothetical protein